MTGVVPAIPRIKFTNALGVPIAAGFLTVYLAGTSEKTSTWQDSTQLTLNTNPIELDANGEALVWLAPDLIYKFLLQDALGVTVSGWPVDNIPGTSTNNALLTAVAAAETARDEAETARDAALGAAWIFSTKALGLTAASSGQYFSTKQTYDGALDLWLDSAGTAVYQESIPYGIGQTAEMMKAVEDATIADWPVNPDLYYDCLDSTGDGRYIQNRMAAVVPNKNMLPLSTGELRKGNSADTPVTARAAVGPDGVLSNAAEFTFAGANVNVDVITLLNGEILQPGTYRYVAALKSKTGSGAQNIQFWESVGGTTSIVGTLDAGVGGSYGNGWDAKTFTITVATAAAYTVRLRSQGAGNAFWIDQVRFFEDDGNAVPAWANETAGHIKNIRSPRGILRRDGILLDLTNSTLSNGVAPLSTFPSSTVVTDVTVLVCASVDDVTQDNVATLFGADSNVSGVGALTFRVGTGNSSPESYRNNGAIVVSPDALEYSRINIRGEGFHIWGGSLSAAKCRKFFNGITYWDYDQDFAGFSSPTMLFGAVTSASKFKGKPAMVACWLNKDLTEAQVQSAMALMKLRLLAKGKAIGSFRDVLMSEGDSRNAWASASPDGPGWNHQVADHNYFGTGLPSLKCFNIGWGSSVLGTPSDTAPPGPLASNYAGSTIYSRLPETLVKIARCHAMGLRIFFTYLNDINDTVRVPANPTQYSTDEKVYLQTIRTALDAGGLGSKLFLFTCTPVHGNATFEAARGTLNTLRRAYPATLVHGIIDVAANATLGTYSATPAPAGYVDTLHWNNAGGAIAATLAKAAISPYRLY